MEIEKKYLLIIIQLSETRWLAERDTDVQKLNNTLGSDYGKDKSSDMLLLNSKNSYKNSIRVATFNQKNYF